MAASKQKPNRSEWLRRCFESSPEMTYQEAVERWEEEGQDPSLGISASLFRQIQQQEGRLWFRRSAQPDPKNYSRPTSKPEPEASNGVASAPITQIGHVMSLPEVENEEVETDTLARLSLYELIENDLEKLAQSVADLGDDELLQMVRRARRVVGKTILDLEA